MKKQFLFLLLAVILLSSCATATLSEFPGVGRVKQYDFYSYDIPPAFDGFRIGFASDFHYESRFKRSELNSAVRALPMWKNPVGLGAKRTRTLFVDMAKNERR